ncbi:hypothetical protein ILYODFUR_025226, partial [Ilyodon furcidens]
CTVGRWCLFTECKHKESALPELELQYCVTSTASGVRMAFCGNMIWIICIFVPLVHPVWSQYSKLNSLKFQHYSTMVTWQEAQYACRKSHTDLLTIRNEKQRQNVSHGQGWIGLYRENNAGPWKWSRGDDKATFFFWRLGGKQNYIG